MRGPLSPSPGYVNLNNPTLQHSPLIKVGEQSAWGSPSRGGKFHGRKKKDVLITQLQFPENLKKIGRGTTVHLH